jgi:uncharacterized protein (DUF1800 family)
MPLSKDLFLSILAMDTYNRGYNVVFGWSVGAGIYTASQAQLAAQFFQQVVANGNPNQTLADLYNANVLLTGHSDVAAAALSPREFAGAMSKETSRRRSSGAKRKCLFQ